MIPPTPLLQIYFGEGNIEILRGVGLRLQTWDSNEDPPKSNREYTYKSWGWSICYFTLGYWYIDCIDPMFIAFSFNEFHSLFLNDFLQISSHLRWMKKGFRTEISGATRRRHPSSETWRTTALLATEILLMVQKSPKKHLTCMKPPQKTAYLHIFTISTGESPDFWTINSISKIRFFANPYLGSTELTMVQGLTDGWSMIFFVGFSVELGCQNLRNGQNSTQLSFFGGVWGDFFGGLVMSLAFFGWPTKMCWKRNIHQKSVNTLRKNPIINTVGWSSFHQKQNPNLSSTKKGLVPCLRWIHLGNSCK